MIVFRALFPFGLAHSVDYLVSTHKSAAEARKQANARLAEVAKVDPNLITGSADDDGFVNVRISKVEVHPLNKGLVFEILEKGPSALVKSTEVVERVSVKASVLTAPAPDTQPVVAEASVAVDPTPDPVE